MNNGHEDSSSEQRRVPLSDQEARTRATDHISDGLPFLAIIQKEDRCEYISSFGNEEQTVQMIHCLIKVVAQIGGEHILEEIVLGGQLSERTGQE